MTKLPFLFAILSVFVSLISIIVMIVEAIDYFVYQNEFYWGSLYCLAGGIISFILLALWCMWLLKKDISKNL